MRIALKLWQSQLSSTFHLCFPTNTCSQNTKMMKLMVSKHFIPDIFERLAKWWCHHLNHNYLIKYACLYAWFVAIRCYQMCFTILSFTILLPWQHSGSQSSQMIMAILPTFGLPVWNWHYFWKSWSQNQISFPNVSHYHFSFISLPLIICKLMWPFFAIWVYCFSHHHLHCM